MTALTSSFLARLSQSRLAEPTVDQACGPFHLADLDEAGLAETEAGLRSTGRVVGDHQRLEVGAPPVRIKQETVRARQCLETADECLTVGLDRSDPGSGRRLEPLLR